MYASLQLQAAATLAARRAGEHVLANLHRRHDASSVKRADIKHKLDVEAEEVAISVIRSAFPDHAILAEESCNTTPTDADVLWIIDPIDGTVNFFHGLPIWCCSIAVQVKGVTTAAAVYLPEMGELYEATIDGPALCNSSPIRVSDATQLELAMIATGADKWDSNSAPFRFLNRIAAMAQRPRILGAAALDLCYVAAGKIDGYFESGIYLWDVAAGKLIVERAGGKCTVMQHYTPWRMAVLATNTALHQPCIDGLSPLIDN